MAKIQSLVTLARHGFRGVTSTKEHTMFTYEQYKAHFARRFAKTHPGQTMPENLLRWMFQAYQQGFHHGQDVFARTHDWYE